MSPSPAQIISELIQNSSLNRRVSERLGITEIKLDKGSPRDDMITFSETHEGGGVYAQTINIPDAWMKIAGASNAQEFIEWLRQV